MTSPDKAAEEQQWREAAARAMALWRGTVGGTYDMLTSALRVGLATTSLAQCLRPGGRKPRQASDMLADIARLLAEKLADRRPDMTLVQFEEAMRKHVVGGAPSPLDRPSPVSPATSTSRNAGVSPALFTFDLWTPGQSPEAIIRVFAPHLGSDGAEMLTSMAREATESIGAGDFDRQLEIAERTIRLGDGAPETPLRGEGLYLKAEALRLMADFEADRSEVRSLRRDAERLYAEAEDALCGDPRPIRGRARTLEVLGDLDEAMTEFDRAIAAVEARGSSIREHDHLSMTHERVRSLRHKMNCLVAMHAEHPLATAHAQRRGEQIRRLIAASEPQHGEALQLLTANESWWQIEWFMAQVLHAKAWSAVKEDGKAAKRLEWSLDIRLKMMASDGRLTAVEQGNLHWWIGVARGARGAFEASQQSALEELKSALDRGESRAVVKALGQAFITAGAAPWKFHKPQT